MRRLVAAHGVTQLVVNGKPFLMRGGELENSSASSLAFMDAHVWPKAVAMHFKSVLAPVYWQLIEPAEGHFDWTTVDGLIRGARAHRMHLVLLWFGSWKNSMSCYAPDWVKEDSQRFPRAQMPDGRGMEILPALSHNNLEADATAFATLMRHLKAFDETGHTVLMVQVENEVGMIPEPRDFSPAANAAFHAPVPKALTEYLAQHRNTLAPALKQAWESHGSKTGADWAHTFGAGPMTEELFNAWTEARFTGEVAARGKAVYPLPMYVNAALIRPGKQPGEYPSGGPLPHLYGVWRAATLPAIDMQAPDVYFPNFVEWVKRYMRPGNPLFIPETGRASAATMGGNAFYEFGQLDAMGFSVYAPESLKPKDEQDLAADYDVIDQLTPLILANQGTGHMVGIDAPLNFTGAVDLTSQNFTLGGYTFDVHFTEPSPISAGVTKEPEIPGAHGGIIIQLGQNEFLVAGTGMIMTFGLKGHGKQVAGIDGIREGSYVNGVWTPGRNLNGDDDNQGRFLRLPSGIFTIRRVKLYRYQ